MNKNHPIFNFFAILIAIGIIGFTAYYVYDKMIAKSPNNDKNKFVEETENNQVQYKMSYKGSGNLKQIIHLNQGPALFKIKSDGKDNFRVLLKNTNDSLIAVMVDVNGGYDNYKTVDAPKDDAYILFVETTNLWSIAYK